MIAAGDVPLARTAGSRWRPTSATVVAPMRPHADMGVPALTTTGYPSAPTDDKEDPMPPRGVRKGTKRARQYEHVKDSELQQGRSESRAEEIAARTVNKERARAGESRTRSRSSTNDISSGRRGGLRSGRPGPRGRTRDQLYAEARRLGVEGRSKMTKAQLQRAVAGKRGS